MRIFVHTEENRNSRHKQRLIWFRVVDKDSRDMELRFAMEDPDRTSHSEPLLEGWSLMDNDEYDNISRETRASVAQINCGESRRLDWTWVFEMRTENFLIKHAIPHTLGRR